jgi:hypothetical protein
MGVSPNSHKTLPGVRCSIRIHISNVSGRILKLLLKQQKTNPFSGSPHSARVTVTELIGRFPSFT